MLALQARVLRSVAVSAQRLRRAGRAARTSASRRSSTRSSGAKVAIVSDKPQTTRRAIRGVATGRRLAARARRPARRAAPARRAHRSACSGAWSASWRTPTPRCCSSTASRASARATASSPHAARPRDVPGRGRGQQDRPPRPGAQTAAALQAAAELDVADDVFPISARTRQGRAGAVEHLAALAARGAVPVPARRALRPVAEDVLLAELVREQVLRAHVPGGAARGRGRGRGDRARPRRPDRGAGA